MEGENHEVQVIADHQNLELFQTTKILHRRQARWAQELAGYDFRIFFRPGRQNITADYLSRHPESRLEERGDRKPETILKTENIGQETGNPEYYTIYLISGACVCSIPPIKWNEEFLKEVRSTASQDEQYQTGWHSLSANPDASNYIKPSEHLTTENDILHYKAHRYIPRKLISTILESEHDSRIARHFGIDKTIELI